MDQWLGPDLSLELCIRLFALVHDMPLLPLGHTLQYQLGFFKNAKVNNRRSEICLQRIRKEIPEALRVGCPCWSGSFSQLRGTLSRHLDVVEELFRFRHPEEMSSKNSSSISQTSGSKSQVPQTFPFILDLITSTFSADLVDFASRDSLGAGWPRSYNEKVGKAFCVFRLPANGSPRKSPQSFTYRFGLNPLNKTYRHDVVNGVIALQRVRYELQIIGQPTLEGLLKEKFS